MYAKYAYTNTATQANMLADIVAILTGETTVNNLSSSCDKASSTITATVAAGWSLYDNAAGTNAKCLRAINADGTTYKYIVIDTNTDSNLYCKVYETWDSGTHTGTNIAYNSNSNSYNQRFSRSVGGVIYIFASARYCLFFGEYGIYWGSAGNNGCPTGVVERTRIGQWDTVAKGYPPFFFMATFGITTLAEYAPRLLRYDNTAVTGSTAKLSVGTITGFITATYPTTYKIIDANGNPYLPLFPLYVLNYSLMNLPIGEISSLTDFYMVPINTAAHLDTFTLSGKNYIIFKCSTTHRYAFRAE